MDSVFQWKDNGLVPYFSLDIYAKLMTFFFLLLYACQNMCISYLAAEFAVEDLKE